MNLERIQSGLSELFATPHRWSHEGRRIVFWYDTDGQFTDVFADLELPGVSKLELSTAVFTLKHRLLVLEPETTFLLYAAHAEPAPLENWLLDVQSYSLLFSADRAAMLMQEFGFLNRSLEVFLRARVDFFASKKRAEAFVALQVPPEASEREVRLAILCVLTNVRILDGREAVRQVLKAGLAEADNPVWAEVVKHLEPDDFWRVVEDTTGYRESQATPSLRRLFVRLLVTHLERGFHGSFPLALEHQVIVPSTKAFGFVDVWSNHVADSARLMELSGLIADDLNLLELLSDLPVDAMFEARSFEVLDKVLISLCVQELLGSRIEFERWRERLRVRRNSLWHGKYQFTYRALELALDLLELIALHTGSFRPDVTVLFSRYVQELHRVDRAYREYIVASDASPDGVLKPLTDQIEAVYVNDFQHELGSAWSDALERGPDRWGVAGVTPQTLFFDEHVRGLLERDERSRVCVLISDALRYEVAVELQERLRRERAGEVTLTPLVSVLPSVTKFGMAALLPAPAGSGLQITDAGFVTRAGLPTNLSTARAQVLNAHSGVIAQTFNSDEVLSWSKTTGREALQPYRLVYIYHNEIDSTGDKAASERDVMQACERAINELLKLVNRLVGNLNLTTVILTSDHGFLYQRQEIEESDKLEQPRSETPYGERSLDAGQRHVLGTQLEARAGTLSFQPDWTNDPNVRVLVPRGSLRFKASGGKQYVHGGASLQEVCVPVLVYRDREGIKAQEGAPRKVGVQVIGSQRRITNNRFVITLMQNEAVGGRFKPRTVTVLMRDERNQLVTNEARVDLSAISPHPTERSIQVPLNVVDPPKNGSSVWLIVLDSDDDAELSRESWTVHLAISDEFGDR
jgi:uncharacterized protein (TIGR02687 family)